MYKIQKIKKPEPVYIQAFLIPASLKNYGESNHACY